VSVTYPYPRPAVTVDCVVFGLDAERLQVLLIQRDLDPFAGSWALPGGFVQMDEDLETAARRELLEETGISDLFLEQLFTFGQLGRDPRHRTITVAYYALVKLSEHSVRAATDARDAAWFPVDAPPELAFDHAQILATAIERLRGKVRYQPIGFELLPAKFPLSQLRRMYEVILGRGLDKRNFRKKVRTLTALEALDERETGVARRPAQLYRFDRETYERLKREGIHFQL
jgi:8-oxo-dGTP diphosphatase